MIALPYSYAEPNFNAADVAKDKWVKDTYIIKFNGDEPDMSKYKHLTILNEYYTIFRGIAVEATTSDLSKLMQDTNIETIQPVELFQLPFELEEFGTFAIPPDIETKQYIKPGTTRHNFHLNPSVNAGDGVTNVPLIIAVVDTGCTLEHPDLNYLECHDFTNSIEGFDDLSGHGTHVAGTIAAINNGFGVVGGSPGAGIIGLKVCGGGGSNSCPTNAILGGWDWLAANGKDKGVLVNNNSWGGSRGAPTEDGNCGFTDGDLIHQALCAMTDVGIVTVMSAGNSNADGVNFVGCGYDEAICVSAMDDTDGLPGGDGPNSTCRASSDDTIAGFSNFGKVVDISADGVCEPSTVPDCSNGASICHPTGYLEISGTSMSGPQVAGGVALAVVHLYGFDGAQNKADVLAVNNFIKGTGFPIGGPDGFSCNKPSGCAEPLLNAISYTFEPRIPFHDISLTSPAVANPIGLGFTENISFSTVNLGTFEETYTVELRIDGELFFADTVTLGELQTKNYEVEWTPDTVSTVVLTTSILDPPAEDSNPDNNGGITEVEVIERIRDVKIVSLKDAKPTNWVAGVECENCLSISVKNDGNFAETINAKITHEDGGAVVFERTYVILPNRQTTSSVDIRASDTTVIDGVNTFRGEINNLPNDDPSDNVKITEVIASEANRHNNIRNVFFIGPQTWVEDEQNRLRLWCHNDGTETIGVGGLSYGIFEGDEFRADMLLVSDKNDFIMPVGDGEIESMVIRPFQLSPGDYTLTGFCDYLEEIDERDETNNKRTLAVTVFPAEPEPELPPVADAGPDQSKQVELLVTLDGSLSSDPNNDPLTYAWTITSKPVGSATVLSDPTIVNPTLTPDLVGDYNIQLIVNDGTADSLVDSVKITATPLPPPPDTTPPTVTIVSPSEGDILSGKVTIRVIATDDSGIREVTLFIDGKKFKGTDDSAPYNWSLQTQSKKGLDHTIKATACDIFNNCASTSIDVQIINIKGNK